MSNNSKVWFVTGSSRGLGRAIVEEALKSGARVAATARKPESLADLQAEYGDRLLTLPVDVTDTAQVAEAVTATKKAFGHLDIVVNNAGYGFMGAFEEMTEKEFRDQIDTNFWGVVNVTRAVVPILREQGSGHILQISSIGGRQANAGLSAYQAAKFAVEGFSEALAQEVGPLGIAVTIVEPGGFHTDWAGASMAFATPIEAYAPTVGVMRQVMQSYAGVALGDAVKGAKAIVQVAGSERPPLRLPLGSDAYHLLKVVYQRNADELEQTREITTSTDRDDLPPFDAPAFFKMLGVS